MRIVTIALTLAFFSNVALAQNAVIKKDTLFKDGKPYCILKEQKMSETASDFSLRDLAGSNELVYIKFEKPAAAKPGYYWFNFRESGNEVKVNTEDKAAIPNIVLNADFVKDGSTLDIDKEDKFVLDHNGVPKKRLGSSESFKLVPRNTAAPITVMGENIMQEMSKIGFLKEQGTYINKVFTMQLLVFLPNGQNVAEATYAEKGAAKAQITTTRDNKTHDVQLSLQQKPRRQVLDWLVKNQYL